MRWIVFWYDGVTSALTSIIIQLFIDGLGIDDEEVDVTGRR